MCASETLMRHPICSSTAVLLLAGVAQAQVPHPEVTVDWTEVERRIAWFGTIDGALAAAERTHRPILLVSGAPHCQLVPGVW